MIRLRTISMEDAPEEIQEYVSSLVNYCSAMHISYIAVDKKYQNQKYGTYILKSIIVKVMEMRQHFPITIITLDALKEKYEWYKKWGFAPFSENDLETSEITIPMYIKCILNQEAVDNYCCV